MADEQAFVRGVIKRFWELLATRGPRSASHGELRDAGDHGGGCSGPRQARVSVAVDAVSRG